MTGSDSPSSGPKYRQLADRIRKRIKEGTYESGQPIPLAEDPFLEVPKTPSVVQRAFRLLEEEGWLSADRKGVWLASAPREVRGVLLGWDPADTQPGGSPDSEIRVVSKVTGTLPVEFLEHFEVHGVDGKRASRIVKVLIEKGRPIVLETILAPTSMLPGLVMKDHRHENIYQVIQTGYKTPISRVSQRVYLRSATEEEALALQIVGKTTVLGVDRILFGGGTGVAVVRLVYPDPQRGFYDEACASFSAADISR